MATWSPNSAIYGTYGNENYDKRVSGNSPGNDLDNHNIPFLAECAAGQGPQHHRVRGRLRQSLTQQLTQCASPGKAYYASDNASLQTAFRRSPTRSRCCASRNDRAPLRRLAGDRRGNTVIEFAIVAPVMIALIMGLLRLGFQIYAQSVLDGAVQKAARDSALQGGAQSTGHDRRPRAVDADAADRIAAALLRRDAAKHARPRHLVRDPQELRQFRRDQAGALFPTPTATASRDPGECFQDVNGNFAWDADPGSAGQGGANDVTLYTFSVTYPRLFPIAAMIGWPSMLRMTSTTILKNQPTPRRRPPSPRRYAPDPPLAIPGRDTHGWR